MFFLLIRGPSKPEYIAAADRICRKSNKSFAALPSPKALNELRGVGVRMREITTELVKDLRALELPRGDDDLPARAAIRAMDSSRKAADSLVKAAIKEDLAASEKAAGRLRTRFDSADDKARQFGFAHCGKGGAKAAQAVAAASPAVLKGTLVAKANALCATMNQQVDALSEPQSLEQFLAQIDQLLALISKALSDIEGLSIPPAEKEAVDLFVADMRNAMAKLAELRDAFRSGSETRVIQVLGEFDALIGIAEARADAFGLSDCGSGV